MKTVHQILDKNFQVGAIDPRIYGVFVENVNRVFYGCVYNPGHPAADKDGFRKDYAALLKELGATMIRFPGGNYVSAYHWKNGVGPREQRPKIHDLAWGQPDAPADPNEVGIDEFADYCKKLDVEFMIAANLGTGTAEEAAQEVEYCNRAGGTYWSDLRRKYGHEAPHGLKLWCLGNEMDGDWQAGHLLPMEYARKAEETAKLMKNVDPTIELSVCGSCGDAEELRTYPDWDRIVLDRTYPYVDLISIHKYLSYLPAAHMAHHHKYTVDDIANFPVEIERFYETVLAAADLARGKHRGEKKLRLSVDEWGVITSNNVSPAGKTWTPGPSQPFQGDLSAVIVSNLVDALLFGSYLMTFINHADRVGAACQTQVLGAMIAVEADGSCWKQSTFYPFAQAAHFGRGVALEQRLSVPQLETPNFGAVPAAQTAAAYDEETGTVTVFAVNFSFDEELALETEFLGFGDVELVEHLTLTTDEPMLGNTKEEPNRIVPRALPVTGSAPVLPKLSWNVLRYKVRA